MVFLLGPYKPIQEIKTKTQSNARLYSTEDEHFHVLYCGVFGLGVTPHFISG